MVESSVCIVHPQPEPHITPSTASGSPNVLLRRTFLNAANTMDMTGPHPRITFPLELSPQQSAVVNALRAHENGQYRLSDWYLGALYTLSDSHNPDRFSQAAQSLRELLEKLPEAVGESDPSQLQSCTRRERLEGVVANVDPLGSQMDSATWHQRVKRIEDLRKTLVYFAHHRASDEQAVNDHLRSLERAILDLLAPITAQGQEEIQSILDKSSKSVDDVGRIFELVAQRGANYRFFFAHVSDPSWIAILKDRGYFSNPPCIQELDDGQVHMPPWWPMRYLTRMATLFADEVIDTVKSLPQFNNPNIYANILEIALQLPGEQSVELLPEVLQHAKTPTALVSYRIPDLLTHWTNEGQLAAALDLAKSIVYFAPDPEREEKQARRRENPSDWTTALQPFPRLESWDYLQVMENGTRALATAEPRQSAKVLISAVDRLTSQTLHQDEIDQGREEDYSELWYPNLRGPLDEVLQPEAALVFTMTFACERAWEDDPTAIPDLHQYLHSRRWRIFRRLRQHLYALYPSEQTKPWIRDEILDHLDYASCEHHYEFQQMIRAACETFVDDLLIEDERATIFEAILSGPDQERFRRFASENYTDELFEMRRRNFHQMQLQPFRTVLFGKYRDYFQELEEGSGLSIANEDYRSVGPSRSGTISGRSPSSAAELTRLDDEDLLSHINLWDDEHHDAEDWFVEVTVEALSDVFEAQFRDTVIPNSDRLRFWLDNRDRIERPIYVRKMIGAMISRIEAQDFGHLDQWLELCEWVLAHPDQERVPSIRPGDQSRENPYWGDCRRAVGGLLGKLITTGLDNGLPVPSLVQHQLPILLDTLCTAYDWSLDGEQRVFPGRDDWMGEAINNTRSRALADLMRLGRWLRQEDPQADATSIKNTLEKRFAPTSERPLTLPEYAILALHYADAMAMDEAWATTHRGDFYPRTTSAPGQPHLELFCAITVHTRGSLKSSRMIFSFAVEHLPLQADENSELSALLDILGQRLFGYYAGGMFPLLGEDSPIESYYLATGRRRQHWANLFANVGRGLYHVEGELDEEVKRRHETFFEWRLDVGDPAELAQFNSWLASSCLSTEWRLDAYSRVLDVCDFDQGRFWHHWEPMTNLIPEHTSKVVECFTKLVGKLPRGSYIPPGPATKILRAGLASEDPTVRQDAERAREILFASGRLDASILDE